MTTALNLFITGTDTGIGKSVVTAALLRAFARLDLRVLVEGIGGWALPLGGDDMLADLPRRLDLPVLLVVGVRLGALNHGLLTARAIAADGLPLAGWIANVLDPDYAWSEGTIDTLAARLPAPLLARVPFRPGATPDTMAPFLADAAARLLRR